MLQEEAKALVIQAAVQLVAGRAEVVQATEKAAVFAEGQRAVDGMEMGMAVAEKVEEVPKEDERAVGKVGAVEHLVVAIEEDVKVV